MVSYAADRRAWLASVQNSDGGWGYAPGASSWLEPSAWAALALLVAREYAGVVQKALALISLWQRPDGSYRPQAAVDEPAWATSLAIILQLATGQATGKVHTATDRAAHWLLETKGAEGALWRRVLARLGQRDSPLAGGAYGWAWVAGTSSWIEPTVHAALALRGYLAVCPGRTSREHEIRYRIAAAERMLLERRCADAGWNYGA